MRSPAHLEDWQDASDEIAGDEVEWSAAWDDADQQAAQVSREACPFELRSPSPYARCRATLQPFAPAAAGTIVAPWPFTA